MEKNTQSALCASYFPYEREKVGEMGVKRKEEKRREEKRREEKRREEKRREEKRRGEER